MSASHQSSKMTRKDRYYLLKTRETVNDMKKGSSTEMIYDEEVDLDTYTRSGGRQRAENAAGVRCHGRRFNDEVELFEWDQGKETPGLRKALESNGLKVRTYIHEPERHFPRPSFRSVMGKDAVPRTDEEKCLDAMAAALTRLEEQVKTSIPFAVLVDADKAERKLIVVVKFRPDDFYDFYYDHVPPLTLNTNGVELDILGAVEARKPSLLRMDEEVVSFFKPKREGEDWYVDVVFFDHARVKEEEELRALKAEKKKAKKQRREATASSASSLFIPEGSGEHKVAGEEDESAIKARQKDKAKAKRRAQKERKKAEALAQQEERTLISVGKGKGKKGDTNFEISLGGSSGPSVYVVTEHGRRMVHHGGGVVDLTQYRQQKRRRIDKGGKQQQQQKVDEDDGDEEEEEDEPMTLTLRRAGEDENEDEEDDKSRTPSTPGSESEDSGEQLAEGIAGLQIIQFKDGDDIMRTVREARGPIYIAHPIDEGGGEGRKGGARDGERG